MKSAVLDLAHMLGCRELRRAAARLSSQMVRRRSRHCSLPSSDGGAAAEQRAPAVVTMQRLPQPLDGAQVRKARQ